MTDYKKYALDQVENFLYDALSTDATPQEIYDVIKGVVEDNYKVYTESAKKAQDLLSLLNGHRSVDLEHSEHYYDYNRNKPELVPCDRNNTSEECEKSWNDFWKEPSMPPWGHSDLEYGIHYSDEELDAMCAAAEVEQDMKNIDDFLKQDRDSNFPGENTVKDKVKKWVLPVEETKIEETDETEYFITFPDDLLEAANLKEGDQIEWSPQSNGSYILQKVK
jgi:hypothetical protein